MRNINRKRTGCVLALLVGLVFGLAYLGEEAGSSSGIVPSVQAQSGCTNSTLSGTFAWAAHGLISAENNQGIPNIGAFIPIAAIGFLTFDGSGGVTGTHTQNVGTGFIGLPPYTGNYTVNGDCTGTLTTNTFVTIVTNWSFIIVNKGEIVFLDRNPRALLTGSAKKIAIK